jgi:Asp-tRNA(Asn)/Glu-tRNA(Gln) amidotransferase A subunit family amidase
MNPYFLSATAALTELRSGTFSSVELVQSCLKHIEQRESVVGAWEYLKSSELLLQHANQCDALRAAGTLNQPLLGIPVAVKDIFATSGMPTRWGTPIHAGQYLEYDAAPVERLKAAGAIIVGKTVTTEYAAAQPGKTSNPHALSHTPGGSSSGSAAAVADCMLPLAIGSQTIGSTLRPAKRIKATKSNISMGGRHHIETSLRW